jgi:hypothetical protein
MDPVILFRKTYREQDEYETASRSVKVVPLRTMCRDNLVVCRYSCLPHYRELQKDLEYNGCKMINTYDQHAWIADFGYYQDLKEFTAKTWNSSNFYTCDHNGPFVVKGATNSMKHRWKDRMFAKDRVSAIKIGSELMQDGLICDQDILYRKFEKFKVLDINLISEQPYINEWRFFYLGDTLLSYGFYWGDADDSVILKASIDNEGISFAQKIAEITCEFVNFFVLDIAELESGGWMLVEINDGQCSGLSENKASVLYENLSKALKNKKY